MRSGLTGSAQEGRHDMTASQDSTSETVVDQRPESALLVAARQLSEEAALHPRLAGLSGVRQRAAVTRTRRATRRMTVMPTG